MAKLFDISTEQYETYEDKKKRKWMIFIVAVIILAGIGLLIVLTHFFGNQCYLDYEVQNEVERKDSNNGKYCFFNNNIIKYSRSGVSAINNKGEILWNGGYEMSQPQVDTCGEFAVVADVTGKQIYVYNGEDEGVSIETTLPIVRVKVAAQGVVAALLQDSESNVLNIYNPYSSADKLLVEIPTNVSEEGYPLDFDISPDGNSLAMSFMVVNGRDVENRVSFYNFTEVGQDKNTMVGGKSFGEKMISYIEFVEEDAVAVFHESGYSLFRGMKQPEVAVEKTFDGKIHSMVCDESHVAVVENMDEKKKLSLFQWKGKLELEREISFSYADMQLCQNEIIFTSTHDCHILRTNGTEKFIKEFENEIEAVFPTGSDNVYTLIDSTKIQKIKLIRG